MITINYSYSKAQYIAEDYAGNVLGTYDTLAAAVTDLEASGEAYEVSETAADEDAI